jgi:hypothetical protein
MPSLLCLGQEQELINDIHLTASGTAARSTLTGVSGAFGADTYDFDSSGGAVWSLDDNTVGGVPAAESRAYFAIWRPRTLASDDAICGKQNGVSEGWNFVFAVATPAPRLVTVTASTTLANMDLTAASAVANQWRCLCAVFDRTSGEVRFASDLEAATPIALPAQAINPAGHPLRIGDSRVPPSTLGAPDAEIALVAEVTEDADTIDPQTAAAALLAKFLNG